MFDFSTLITDRTLEDVAARNEKGSYNATDLNRVDACLEDLVARLNRVGCLVPGYVRVKIERETKPSSRLPDGYTEVQYIQSSGTQYVDTGFQPNNNTKIEVDVKLTNTKCHVFGARTSWKNNAFALFWSSGASECVQLANQNFNGGTYDEKARHEISMTSTELRIDEKLNATYSVGAFQCNQTAWLMSCYSSSASEYAHGNLYFAKIYDNGELIRDCIPCIDPSGTVGIYDAVDGTFYGNAGTGVFLAGPVVERPKDPNDGLDLYTWYESDTPTFLQLSQYRANVDAVRSALQLPDGTPVTPDSMRRLTTAEANSIEAILLALNFILNNIPAAVRHCGVTVCGSKGVRA